MVGEVSTDVIAYLRRLFPDTRLHICGDGWSNGQGWVEGALETAEAMLVNEFGMPELAAY
jgi:monoamine oxidase